MIQDSAALTASVNATLYNAETKAAALDVTLINRGAVARRVRLALATTGAPSAADWIEYDAGLLPGYPVINWPVIVPQGRRLVAVADGADCSAQIHGEEIANATAFAGSASLSANTDTVLTTLAADAEARVYYVNLVTRGTTPVRGRVAVSAGNVPDADEWLEYDGLIRPGFPLRRWPLIVKANQRLVVRTDGASVSATFWGRTYGAPIA